MTDHEQHYGNTFFETSQKRKTKNQLQIPSGFCTTQILRQTTFAEILRKPDKIERRIRPPY
jgi:hypothetical protein